MKKIIFGIFLIIPYSFAQGYCVEGAKPVVDNFKVVHISPALTKCRGNPSGTLRLPGCEMTVFSSATRSELKAYGNSELCGLQKGQIVRMKISSSCCDVDQIFSCLGDKDRLLTLISSQEQLSCNSNIGKYVDEYVLKKEGVNVVRVYDTQKKLFVDSKSKDIKNPKK